MATVIIQSAAFRPAPRGAVWAAELIAQVVALFESRPVPSPAVSDRAREAEAVREMARRVEATEPGFAADLYAAAARHENLPE